MIECSSAGRRLTAIAQKAKEIPPQSRGHDGVETSDENIPAGKLGPSDKSNAGKFICLFLNYDLSCLVTYPIHLKCIAWPYKLTLKAVIVFELITLIFPLYNSALISEFQAICKLG